MKLPMKEIAARINAHLERFEKDSEINKMYTEGGRRGLHPYYVAGAYYHGGARIGVRYISFQGTSHLTRAEAMAYLEWLDAGNVGKHYDQQREAQQARKERSGTAEVSEQPAVEHLRQQIDYASSNVVYWLWHAEKKLDGRCLNASEIKQLIARARFAYSCAEVIEAIET